MTPTFDEIRDLREEWEATLDPSAYRERMAAQIAAMQPGQPGRAELLAVSSEDIAIGSPTADELLEAERLAREAIADGGPTTIDAHVALVRVLLDRGQSDEAEAVARDALRGGPSDADTFHAALGEIFEVYGDNAKLALRIYTVGLRDFDPDVDDPDLEEEDCLAGRYRIRRQLQLGTDAFDRCFDEIRPESAEAIRKRFADDER